MKIKLDKPVSRDPNALDAKSRKAAGPFRVKKPRQKLKASDFRDEIDDSDSFILDCDNTYEQK
jgi:predicted sulfurtransferase